MHFVRCMLKISWEGMVFCKICNLLVFWNGQQFCSYVNERCKAARVKFEVLLWLSQLRKFILKLVSAIFYQFFIFSSSDRPSKTMKTVFYLILKALFIHEIFKFLYFFPFLSTLSRFKRSNGSGIIYDVINWLA